MKVVVCSKCGSNELVQVDRKTICPFCRSQYVPDFESVDRERDLTGKGCPRCGLGDRIVVYPDRRSGQENAAKSLLGRVEFAIPKPFDADPMAGEFDIVNSKLDEVRACGRCSCLYFENRELQPESICELIFGPVGLLRMYERRSIGVSMENSTFGNRIFRKKVQCSDKEIVGGRFENLLKSVPFEPTLGRMIRNVKFNGTTTVWLGAGHFGTQVATKSFLKFQAARWWLTGSVLVSAMHDPQSQSAIYSILVSTDFSSDEVRESEIESAYQHKFDEFSRALEESVI